MRTNTIIWVLLVIWGFAFAGCSNNNTNDTPSGAVDNAFSSQYPGASGVEWTQYGKYSKADFVYSSQEKDAWYYEDGTWLYTSTEIRYSSLPQAVMAGIAGGIYASWTPESEAEIFEQANVPLKYIVEVEKQGVGDMKLYYTAEGELSKEVTEDYDMSEFPAWMNVILKRHYPNALPLEGEMLLDGNYSAYFLNADRMGTIWFTGNREWNYTGWPVLEKNVPAVVLAVLQGEAYKDYTISSIEYRDTASGSMYRFYLSKPGSVSFYVNVSPQGNIIPD